ncbi:Cytochrome P450 4V2 [Araneus ventricosus]|uniref:Cytochrome P450 4V2 n=1 Tax=Araneus ventricosus TaxID=182803 RepID=A0A4Y2W5F8_ARAVE|nr:Cytochrome P450 4V2 [Araneus ventricosus]
MTEVEAFRKAIDFANEKDLKRVKIFSNSRSALIVMRLTNERRNVINLKEYIKEREEGTVNVPSTSTWPIVPTAHETVANASMWALYLIGLYPEVQAKMHNEIDQIFGEDLERHVTEKDLVDLQYLDCVLKECSRLYPTIPIFAREAKEDIKICGYTIPKGTTCVIPPYFLHRDEDVFPDPEKFDPDRFSPENSASIPECAYIPFSVGPRNCIGFKYAETELKIMICSLLRNFTIESLDPRHEIVPIMNVTLGSLTPIRTRIRSRTFHKSS